MTKPRFESGDRVRHVRRPEWGIGSVLKAEEATVNGERSQRVSVRFPNGGLKTLSSAHAELQIVEVEDEGGPLAEWDKMTESEWLG